MSKKVLILQLDETEQPGFISAYLRRAGYDFEIVQIFKDYSTVEVDLFSHLIVLPSPKDTFECDRYPFLSFAKKIIDDFILKRKYVLGVCMGCQLIAECLGEKIGKIIEPEIGFYKLNILDDCTLTKGLLNKNLNVFEWHSMGILTENKIAIMANSQGCKTQIFQFGDNIFGVQFHLEIDENLIEMYLEKFDVANKYGFIKEMTKELNNFKEIQRIIIDNFLNLEVA
ncbi:type 1 glutamine amidotransferase [Patescibacteria group bacterium]|nr:type 1 glutamine amidotransferase [Patescibacteria group bacterium]MBU1703615.1 type 1 glutamine amidotransferase [Patescibacteria group bacterium]MBU1953554.1 type 1 glutamine amidotransferase [Patescibacteria group bacterium]